MPPPIEWHKSIDSTMTRAAELAAENCPTGTIVAAEEQTAGQGRHGHTWHSPAGQGLYFTVVLRPKVELKQLPIVTLVLGIAAVDALQMFAGITCDLRWPNDVMAGSKKLGGILTQWQNGAVLAGVGLNISQPSFPPDLHDVATSLVLETGAEPDRRVLLRAIAASIDSHVHILETSGIQAILRLFENASSYVVGRRVKVDSPGGNLLGVTWGLTEEGFLRLKMDNGSERIVTAGGVRPAE